MNQELFTYIQKMHHFVEAQDKRILELEKRMKTLSSQLKEVKSRPPIQVDTIEYKFDQLKVETLDGTLNIGLNPSDMEGIEELAVQNKGINATPSPKEKMKRSMELEEEIHQYLEKDLEPVIVNYGKELGKEIDSSYVDFIKNDILKQLPQRIDYYLKQIPEKDRSTEASTKIIQRLSKQMKQDIENAVYAFIKNIPDKKENQHGPSDL